MTTQTEALKMALEGAANYIDVLGGDGRKYRQLLAQQNPQGVSNEQVEQRLELIGHADLAINNIYIFSGYGEEVPEGRTPIYAGYENTHPPVPTAQPKEPEQRSVSEHLEPVGVMVSMDVSKGDEPEYRIFGRIYEVQRDGEGEDEVTYLAIENSRNFDTTPPQRTWVGLMRGVRVDGDNVVISVKGGNDSARELCAYLIDEMN